MESQAPETSGTDASYDDVWCSRYVNPATFRERAARLPLDPRLDLVEAFVAWREQRLDDALRHVLRVIEDGRLEPRWLVRALNLQSVVLSDLGLGHEALQCQLRELELAQEFDDPMPLAIVTHDIGVTYRNNASPQADAQMERAVDLARVAREGNPPGTPQYQECLALEALALLNRAQPLYGRELSDALGPAQALAESAWPDLAHTIRAERIGALLSGPPQPTRADVAEARLLASALPDPAMMLDVAYAGQVARAHTRMALADGDMATAERLAGTLSSLSVNAPPYVLGDLLADLSAIYEELGDLHGALDACRRHTEAVVAQSQTTAQRSVRALEVWHRTRLAEQKAATAQATIDHMRATMHELHRDRERLRARSNRDVLTGLWNRRHLLDTIQALGLTPGHQVAIIDVDQFKVVNDTAGHAAGDDVLRRIADAVQDVCGPDDTAVRYGGDEFVVVRPARAWGSLGEALEPITRLEAHADLGLPVISTSIGVTVMRGEDFASALERADHLMYSAKQSGGGAVVTDVA